MGIESYTYSRENSDDAPPSTAKESPTEAAKKRIAELGEEIAMKKKEFQDISCTDFFQKFGLGKHAQTLCNKVAQRDITKDVINLEITPGRGASGYSIAKNKIRIHTTVAHFERIALQELVHKFLHERYPYQRIDSDRAVGQLQDLFVGDKKCFSKRHLDDFYSEKDLHSDESTSRIMHEGFVDMLMLQDVLQSGNYETAKWEIGRILKKTNSLTQTKRYRLSADLMALMLDVKIERDEGEMLSNTDESVSKRKVAFEVLKSKKEGEILYGKTREELLNMCADLIPKLHKVMQGSMIEPENK